MIDIKVKEHFANFCSDQVSEIWSVIYPHLLRDPHSGGTDGGPRREPPASLAWPDPCAELSVVRLVILCLAPEGRAGHVMARVP